MASDNGHEDFDPETGEPISTKTEPPPPKKGRRSQPQPQPQPQFHRPEPVDTVQQAGENEVLSELLASNRSMLTVERVDWNRDYEDSSRECAECGTVPSTTEFRAEIARRWGGGRYKITGTKKDGTTATGFVRLPGKSLPLSEDEWEEIERQKELERARHRRVPLAPFGPGLGPTAPLPPRPDVPEYFTKAWHPHQYQQQQAELAKLNERISQLEREKLEIQGKLEQERLQHERTKGEVVALKEQIKTESLRRDFDKQIAELKADMARKAVPDTSQKDALAMILEQNRAAEAARQQAADREARAREAEAARQQAWLQQQAAAMQQQLQAFQTAAAGKNPNEVLELATKLAAQFSKQASPIEQLRELTELQRELTGKADDDDEDEDKPWWQQALEKIPDAIEAYRERQNPQPAPQGLPGPGPTGPQAPGGQQGGASMSQGALIMLELVDQVIEQARDGAAPVTAAQALVSWAQQAPGRVEVLQTVIASSPAEIASTLKAQAGSAKARLFLPAEERQKLIEFSNFLEGEKGGAWTTGVLTVLRGK